MSRGRLGLAGVLAIAFGGSAVAAATLKPESDSAWSVYVAATERRIQHELLSREGFLGEDFTPEGAADRKSTRAGRIVVRKLETTDEHGNSIDVPHALVHHWRGSVFIPGETLEGLLAWLRAGAADTGQEDVLQSAVLERDTDSLKIFLKLRRTKVVTAVYNTEHLVTITPLGATRAASTSTATRIAELVDPNTPHERELPPGQDRGFLWRWNAYWRYEQVDGGVIAECESISLSRDLPPVIGFVIRPMVSSAARESMERTLGAPRSRLAKS